MQMCYVLSDRTRLTLKVTPSPPPLPVDLPDIPDYYEKRSVAPFLFTFRALRFFLSNNSSLEQLYARATLQCDIPIGIAPNERSSKLETV